MLSEFQHFQLSLSLANWRKRVVSEWRRSPAGFIDFIVEPTFSVLTEMIEKIVPPLLEEASGFGRDGCRRSR